LSAGEVGWDVMCYVEKLPKKPSKSGMKASDLKGIVTKEVISPTKWRNGFNASTPCIIVDT